MQWWVSTDWLRSKNCAVHRSCKCGHWVKNPSEKLLKPSCSLLTQTFLQNPRFLVSPQLQDFCPPLHSSLSRSFSLPLAPACLLHPTHFPLFKGPKSLSSFKFLFRNTIQHKSFVKPPHPGTPRSRCQCISGYEVHRGERYFRRDSAWWMRWPLISLPKTCHTTSTCSFSVS